MVKTKLRGFACRKGAFERRLGHIEKSAIAAGVVQVLKFMTDYNGATGAAVYRNGGGEFVSSQVERPIRITSEASADMLRTWDHPLFEQGESFPQSVAFDIIEMLVNNIRASSS